MPEPKRAAVGNGAILHDRPNAGERAVIGAALAAGALLLAVKIRLVPRLNINWDEFFFLTHVHALARGELELVLQGAHTHAFLWLLSVGGTEIDQIVAARNVMVALLGATAALVFLLARRWSSPVGATIAALAYLTLWPVVHHGGSFRADSLLAPLLVAMALGCSAPAATGASAMAGGAAFGIAFTISIKSVLLLPVAVGLIALHPAARALDLAARAKRLAWFAGTAVVVGGTLVLAHWFTISGLAPAEVGRYAAGVARKTLAEAPWVPQSRTLRAMASSDPFTWTVLATGLAVAAWRRSTAAICALSLAPILFYRNSFAYFYVVMMAPAAVLVAVAVDAGRALARPSRLDWAVAPAMVAVLAASGTTAVRLLWEDRQTPQRSLVDAVHAIFPSPVPYLDHSGMIASFPKANFFMSSWGVEVYRANGRPFVSDAIATARPPLLIANANALVTGTLLNRRLLPEDQRLLREHYIAYWGPIRVAGGALADATVDGTLLRVPFPGRYRVEASMPVQVDGRAVPPGDAVDVGVESAVTVRSPRQRPSGPLPVRLVWAAAGPPPKTAPPSLQEIYSGL